jgi:hypothetical protein
MGSKGGWVGSGAEDKEKVNNISQIKKINGKEAMLVLGSPKLDVIWTAFHQLCKQVQSYTQQPINCIKPVFATKNKF